MLSPRHRLAHSVAILALATVALAGCDQRRRPEPLAGVAGEGTGAATGGAGTAQATSATPPPPVAPAASEPSPGGFALGPDLINARAQHTLTLLDDGRVLAVGGADGSGTLAEAEVFDPLTSTWQRTRDLGPQGVMLDASGRFPTARQLHTATRLGDGRVLIAGGIGVERLDAEGQPVFEVLRSAYTFDPRTNAFTPAPPLPSPRAWHLDGTTAAGDAVLVGGVDGTLSSTTEVIVFDVRSSQWTRGALASPHTWGAVVGLPGKGLLTLGGGDVQQGPRGELGVAAPAATRCELVGARGAVSALRPTASDSIFAAAAPLSDGGAFLSGGQSLSGSQFQVSAQTELFDGERWRTGPALLTPRYQHRAVALQGGDVLLVGGVAADAQPLATCELFQASTGRMVAAASLAIPRVDHRAVRLRGGQVLVVGGFDAQGQAVAQTELFSR